MLGTYNLCHNVFIMWIRIKKDSYFTCSSKLLLPTEVSFIWYYLKRRNFCFFLVGELLGGPNLTFHQVVIKYIYKRKYVNIMKMLLIKNI